MPYPNDTKEEQQIDHMGKMDDHDCHAGSDDGCNHPSHKEDEGYASMKDATESEESNETE